MVIKNCVAQEVYASSHSMKSKIVLCADHIVDEKITQQAALAVDLVGMKLDSESISIDKLYPINLFFSIKGQVTMEMDEKNLGNYVRFIIINCSSLKSYEPIKILAVLIEELCHCFWCIYDEYEVKFKVMEVLNQYYPQLEINEIFNMDTV